MKQGYTHIQVLLDRSGSMQSILNDTIGGFKNFLTEQQKAEGTATIGLDQFDTYFEEVYSCLNIQEVHDLVLAPRGGTALYDAIGLSIIKTGSLLGELPEDERPSLVLFLIITDGEENSSREYTQEMVAGLIKRQTDEWKWAFHFLAANQDAFKTGGGMHVNSSTTMTYAATSGGTQSAYSGLSSSVVRGRAASMAGMSQEEINDRMKYTDKEREAASDNPNP